MGTWPAHLDLGEAQYELVSNSLAEIKLEVLAARDDPSSTSLLLHLLFVLLIRMGRMDELVPPLAHRAVEQENIYRGFRRDIETHYKESRQARDYASRLGCSGRTLSRAVKSASGMTPKQVIDERIALEAKRLLIYTAWPLKRVALELGFAGSANFIRFFHRTAGFTPEQFRTTYAHRLTTDAEDQARVSARSDPTP
jgi:AraC-like DNA-binding protein